MKNVLKTSLLVSLFAVFAMSCIEEHYVNEAWVFAEEYNVGTDYPWRYDDFYDLFYCTVPVKELTAQIYDEGILAAYIVYYVDGEKKDSPLPYSEFFIDNKGYQWSHQYTCEFSPGKVTFIFRDSNYAISNPPSQTFVVKMMR